MSPYLSLFHQPAFWGLGGAFIYAAPKLAACIAVKYETGKGSTLVCTLEFLCALVVGCFAAGAFSKTVAGFINLPDPNALAALIGLVANPTAPKMVESLSNVVASAVGGRVAEALKKEPPK